MIVNIMEATPGKVWTAPAMTHALREQGWSTPQMDATNAVRTTMARLAQRGTLERLGNGEYCLPTASESESPPGDADKLTPPPALNGTHDAEEEVSTP